MAQLFFAQRRAEKAAKREREAFIYAQLHGETTTAADDLWSSTDEEGGSDEEE